MVGSRVDEQTERKGCKQRKSTYRSRDPRGKPRLPAKAHSSGHLYMEEWGKSLIPTRHKLNSRGTAEPQGQKKTRQLLEGNGAERLCNHQIRKDRGRESKMKSSLQEKINKCLSTDKSNFY